MEYKGEIFDDTIAPMDNSHTDSAQRAVLEGTGNYNVLKENREVYFTMSGV